MSGRELYERYTARLLDRGVECDAFDQLDETDQGAWNDLADEISELLA